MSKLPKQPDELQALLNHLADSPEEADLAELEKALFGNPEACEQYLDYLHLHALLMREFSSDVPAEVLPGLKEASGEIRALPPQEDSSGLAAWGRSWLSYTLVATAAIALTVMIQMQLGLPVDVPETAPSKKSSPVEYVASLVAQKDAVWADEHQAEDGSRLEARELQLLEGTAAIQFDSGAIAILAGHCRLSIKSRSVVRLIEGQITVHAPEEAYGFRVITPSSEIIDLGTEFHVAVDDEGETSLHVLDGEVQAQSRAGEETPPKLLGLGEAVVFDAGGRFREIGEQVEQRRFWEQFSELQSNARESLWAEESFDYPAGRQPLGQLAGGQGWQGPWRGRQGEELRNYEDDPGKALEIAHSEGVFAAFENDRDNDSVLRFEPGGAVRLRQMSQPIDLGKNETYYVSFLMKRDRLGRLLRANPEAVDESIPRKKMAFRLTLRSSENYWGHTVCASLPHKRRPVLELGKISCFVSAARFMRRGPLLWVLKIESRAQGDDRVSLRIYEADEEISPVETSLWTVATDAFQSDAKLDLVLVTAAGPTEQWFDEFRVGPSWQAVTNGYTTSAR